jgi:hypothetical protein
MREGYNLNGWLEEEGFCAVDLQKLAGEVRDYVRGGFDRRRLDEVWLLPRDGKIGLR